MRFLHLLAEASNGVLGLWPNTRNKTLKSAINQGYFQYDSCYTTIKALVLSLGTSE